jgi:hypothetical protein
MASSQLNDAASMNVQQGDASEQTTKELVTCPVCACVVRADRLEKHRRSIHENNSATKNSRWRRKKPSAAVEAHKHHMSIARLMSQTPTPPAKVKKRYLISDDGSVARVGQGQS